jgi:LRR receptor-like serine/threonine-protein kinase FLS2
VAGEIPIEIGNLQNLELFNIKNNNVAGPIPFEIFNTSTLQDIAITLNNLSGHLPSNIGLFLPNLQHGLKHGFTCDGLGIRIPYFL